MNDLVEWPQWGMGSARGFFDKGGSCSNQNWAMNENGALVLLTNYLAFSWAKIQYVSSNDWEWSNADQEMAYLTNLNVQVGVCWSWWYPTNSPHSSAYCTTGCTADKRPCNVEADPPWVAGITTQQYAICKGNFISNFVARYSTPAWKPVTAQGITNGLTFVEPENEPEGWEPANVNMSIAILKASQGARTNGVQLIGWTSWTPSQGSLTNLIGHGLTNWVDGISFHYYPYSDDDPSAGHPTPYSGWDDQTHAYLDSTNSVDDIRIDQWLNWMHTQIPTNFTCYVTELGVDYEDPTSYQNLPWVPINPNRMAKYVILLKAGGVTGINLNGELWYDNDNPANGFPYPVSSTGRAAIWAAYWLQNLPFSGLVSNGNAFAYSFGEGPDTVTFAWTFEGTNQAYTATNYSAMTDLYGNELSVVTNLTSDIIVLRGEGTISFTAFSASPTYGPVPLNVQFNDLSGGGITNRYWQFGDGFVANTPEPTVVHQYTVPGTNTVQLIVSTPNGDSTNIQSDLVITTPFPPPLNAAGTNGLPPFAGNTPGGNGGGTNGVESSAGGANSNWRFLIAY
jgi:PKD repeat protein